MRIPNEADSSRFSARNQAADVLIDRESVRDHAVDQLGAATIDLGRRAFAYYGARTSEAAPASSRWRRPPSRR